MGYPVTIIENKSLRHYNSFGIDVNARYFMALNSVEDIAVLREWLSTHDLPYLILGGGSNCIFTKDFQGLIVHVGLLGRQLVSEDENYYYFKAQAGENWHQFVRWTIAQGGSGLENLSLIPGTVGAAPVQNIGAYGVELVDHIHTVEVVDLESGEAQVLDKEFCQFAYRDSYFKSVSQGRLLITAVTFALPKVAQWKLNYAGIQQQLGDIKPTAKNISDAVIALRESKLPNPEVMGNAGSFFKNPIISQSDGAHLAKKHPDLPRYIQPDGTVKISAAWLIDECGWKGYRDGEVGVYKDHALVLVNHGDATGQDVDQLAKKIITSVEQKFSLLLEPEPRLF